MFKIKPDITKKKANNFPTKYLALKKITLSLGISVSLSVTQEGWEYKND